ncbi:MAG: hypothetical protein PHH85_09000 [Candidatus Methanoperedens sp.]|nr:hypothetical protein [Candidatus Methanoperedens sp.]
MSMLIIENGLIKQSITSPLHDASNHTANALFIGEEYSNHLGVVDNFTQAVVAGAGSQTPDATNHKILLSTGISAGVTSAIFSTKKQYTFGSKPIVANFIINDSTIGVGSGFSTQIGFSNNFAGSMQTAGARKVMFFRSISDAGFWFAYTGIDTQGQTTALSVSNGDFVTIIATSTQVLFYVNGALMAIHTTYIPTVAMNIGVSVYADSSTTERTVSVDLMSIKKYN